MCCNHFLYSEDKQRRILVIKMSAHTNSDCTFLFIMYLHFHHPPTTTSDFSHTHTCTLRRTHQNIPFAVFQIASSKATIHWPQSPWQQASALLTLFYWPISSLSDVSVPVHLPSTPPGSFLYKMLILPLTCSFSISVPGQRVYSGELVAIVQLVVYLQCLLPKAKCPSVAYWCPKC